MVAGVNVKLIVTLVPFLYTLSAEVVTVIFVTGISTSGSGFTVTLTVFVRLPTVTVTTALPSATAVTTPFASTLIYSAPEVTA